MERPQPSVLANLQPAILRRLSLQDSPSTDPPGPPSASLVRNSWSRPVVDLPPVAAPLRDQLVSDDVPAIRTSVLRLSRLPTSPNVLPQNAVLPRGIFSLHGELMHAFISYRVSTEGGEGNGLAGRITEKIRELSMDTTKQLQIPHHGWGIWPKVARQPTPFRKEEAKVPAVD